MLSLGDIHVYVSDFETALRFWASGLGLQVTDKKSSRHAAYACLSSPEDKDGPCIHLYGGFDPWEPGTRPEHMSRPKISFDITTSEFDATLIRLLDHGGQQLGEIEPYGNARWVTVADPDGNVFELIEVPA